MTEEKGKLMVQEEEPLSERELAEAAKLLSSLLSRGGAEAALEAGLAAAQEGLRAVAEELERLSRKLLPEVAELDLEAMAGYLFGITDPIGQIQGWFADRFREMAAWFSSAVQGIFGDFWSKVISPVLGGIRFVVDAIKSALDGVAQQVAGLPSSIISGVMGALAPLLEGAKSFLGSLIQGVMAGVSSLASQVGSLFSSLASQVGSVASAVASGFASLASRLGDVAKGILDAVGRVGAAVGEAFGKLVDLLTRSLGELAGRMLSAIQTVVSTMTSLFEKVVGGLAGLGDLMARGFAGLAERVSGIAQVVVRAVAPIAEAVARALGPIADMVGRGFAAMGEWMGKASQALLQVGVSIQGFVNAVLQLPERIRGFFEWIKEAIEGVRRAIEGFFRDPIGAIRAALRDIGEWIWKALPGWLRDAVELLASFFRELRESLGSSPIDLRGFFKGIFDWLAQQIWNMLPDWLRGAIQAIQDFAEWLRRSLEGFARDPMGFLQRGFTWLAQQIWEHLPGWAKDALLALKGWLDDVRKRLEGFAESARRALEDFAKWIWERLPEPLKQFFERVRDFFEQVWRGIVWFFTEAVPSFFNWLWQQLQEFARDPAGYVYRGFRWLGEEIWKRLPDPVKWFFERVREFFEWAWNGLVWLFSEGLPNFFRWLWERVQEFWRDPIGSISRGLYWVGEQIWRLLPDPLKQFITWVRKGLEWLWQQFLEFVKDPIGAIQGFFAWLAERVTEGVKWIADILWKGVEAVFRWLGGVLAGFLELLHRAVVEPLRGVAESVGRAVLASLGWLVGLGQSAAKQIAETVGNAVRAGFEEGKRLLLEAVAEAVGGRGVGEVDLALKVTLLAFGLSGLFDWAASIAKYLSHLNERIFIGYVASLGMQFGIVTVDSAIRKVWGVYVRPARAWYELGEFLARTADTMRHWFFELVPRGFAAVIEPAFMYTWRQACDTFGLEGLPLSAPALPLVVTALQRLGLTGPAEVGGWDAFKVLEDYLMYRGYPKWFREAFLGFGKYGMRAKIRVRDRFGQPRDIPLALVYEMPTPSELAEMMVKDAFASFDDYKRWAERLGVPESVAVFYYFLRFRYPDPRFLWTFALRAAANMLWFRQTPEMRSDAQRDAEPIGAYIPADPADFNGRGGEAFRILLKYLKWQDYAPFAWDRGWPSDAGIIADALADIPSKIDARWMVKWGLFDLLGELGVGAASPPVAIATALEGGGARGGGGPELKMDVGLLCKFLMASGLHPYYVPLSAIAEAMNALSEERTMVRTGVQNLYERGLITLGTAKSLLSGMGVVRFKVAYAAPPDFTWKSFDFGVPIRFLEPEVHLTLVRSAMDRYLEVYGKAVSEVARGVRELALSPEEGERLLREYAKAIGARLSATLGGELGLRVEIAPDEEYFKAWLEYAQLTSGIETVYRLRLLAQRILGWVIYRVATGYVTDEELERVLATLETHFKFTEEELAAVRALAAAVNNIAVREAARSARARVALEEAVPTLSTLAAMAEYVEVPMDFVRQVLAERRVAGTYAELWIRYLMARTIAKEVDTLSSTYRRWVENFAEPVGVGEAIRALMRAGGWTDRELAIYDVDLYLRKAFRVMSLLTPTVRQFVGDALYLSDWERYFEDLLRARGVDLERYKRQVEYYKTLIRNRRLRARVNAYITELVNAYAEGVITEDELRGELEYLRGYGLVDEEIEIVTWIAELRRARRLARRRGGGG